MGETAAGMGRENTQGVSEARPGLRSKFCDTKDFNDGTPLWYSAGGKAALRRKASYLQVMKEEKDSYEPQCFCSWHGVLRKSVGRVELLQPLVALEPLCCSQLAQAGHGGDDSDHLGPPNRQPQRAHPEPSKHTHPDEGLSHDPPTCLMHPVLCEPGQHGRVCVCCMGSGQL
ncbi:hypothetical protein P7K49_026064 [Saguinus oedipus]|uniref:Uncharacterized protein n=1 Tax=Saguinus oedipus TaxID=9490 RepID=A0ABQ9UJT2_SAGOE|nr:hypothetical protein P7K49_026064 [Saguinus oedipus]